MNRYTSMIEQFLDGENLTYSTEPLGNDSDTVIRFSDHADTKIHVHALASESDTPALAVVGLLRIPAAKVEAARRQAAEDDASSRFFCYDVDEDNDLNLTYQFPRELTDEEFRAVLKVVFPVFVMTAFKSYEAYSRLIWGGAVEQLG